MQGIGWELSIYLNKKKSLASSFIKYVDALQLYNKKWKSFGNHDFDENEKN